MSRAVGGRAIDTNVHGKIARANSGAVCQAPGRIGGEAVENHGGTFPLVANGPQSGQRRLHYPTSTCNFGPMSMASILWRGKSR